MCSCDNWNNVIGCRVTNGILLYVVVSNLRNMIFFYENSSILTCGRVIIGIIWHLLLWQLKNLICSSVTIGNMWHVLVCHITQSDMWSCDNWNNVILVRCDNCKIVMCSFDNWNNMIFCPVIFWIMWYLSMWQL